MKIPTAVRRAARKLVRMEARVRRQAQIPGDDVVFVTFALSEVDFMVEAIKATGRKLYVIDPDPRVKPGSMFVSRCRMDRHANGEA